MLVIPITASYTALRAVLADESAQGLVEYAVVIALVAMAAVATLKLLGRRVTNGLGSATNGFS
jgi:Flp pilus assembly pilin Flp